MRSYLAPSVIREFPISSMRREILLALRFGLDLYANVRPVRLFHERLCPLKGVGVEDVNFTVIRENTEGAYVNSGGVFKKGTPDEVATQVEVHTRKGVERIIEYAFQYARASRKDQSLHERQIERHGICRRSVAAIFQGRRRRGIRRFRPAIFISMRFAC